MFATRRATLGRDSTTVGTETRTPILKGRECRESTDSHQKHREDHGHQRGTCEEPDTAVKSLQPTEISHRRQGRRVRVAPWLCRTAGCNGRRRLATPRGPRAYLACLAFLSSERRTRFLRLSFTLERLALRLPRRDSPSGGLGTGASPSTSLSACSRSSSLRSTITSPSTSAPPNWSAFSAASPSRRARSARRRARSWQECRGVEVGSTRGRSHASASRGVTPARQEPAGTRERVGLRVPANAIANNTRAQ